MKRVRLHEGVVSRRLIRELAEARFDDRYAVTAYVNLDRMDTDGDQGVRIRIRNRFEKWRAMANGLDVSGSVRNKLLHALEVIQATADETVGRRHVLGLAFFVDAENDTGVALPTPWPVRSLCFFEKQYVLTPLQNILAQQERFAVCLTDKDNARIYEYFMHQLEEVDRVDHEIPGKVRYPDPFRELEYMRKHVVSFHRHFEAVADRMLKYYQESPFDRLIVGGLPEILPQFEAHLHPYVQQRIVDRWDVPVDIHPEELRQRIVRFEQELLAREAEQIWQQIQERPPAGRALGAPDVLTAIWQARVQSLLIAPKCVPRLRVCPQCSRLTVESSTCPECGAAVEPLGEPSDLAVIEAALLQGGQVRQADPELLKEHDGLAALLRY
ncbi:MAG: hypothetical protein D6725_08885 [Planctomycetota bacterium]|nr:MAG: hypothetical protein D6725_08885 [Planctomycetota bacterium]